MPVQSDLEYRNRGTRFRIFPQAPLLPAFREPEIVWLSPPPDAIRPGPADDRMYVCDPVNKDKPYEYPHYMPPYLGDTYPPAYPGPDGHFDQLDRNSREFQAAHMYAGLRRVLDIWEAYFGRTIDWYSSRHYPQMELIPFLPWDNAQSGYGFIETGYGFSEQMGEKTLFCMNFDVLAHEMGHSIIFSSVGVPSAANSSGEYLGFNESAADLIALLSVLHFDSVVDHLLATTQGNLYTSNELNRLGELSETEQIRTLVTDRKISDFAAGWTDEHPISLPLTGALFDIFVEVFLCNLLEQDLISRELAERSLAATDHSIDEHAIQQGFADAYHGRHEEYKSALLDARDYLGFCLAHVWDRLSPHDLRYVDVADAFLGADREITDGRYRTVILDCFRWREIGIAVIGPKLESPTSNEGGAFRAAPSTSYDFGPINVSYWERMAIAKQRGYVGM